MRRVRTISESSMGAVSRPDTRHPLREQSRGDVSCCFRPRSQRRGWEKVAKMRRADSSKTPCVLIVEDEPLVRLAAVLALEDAGLEVIESGNADEAILILENRSDIRVVFTDIHTCQAP
jgi:PleD family two-component response regulator